MVDLIQQRYKFFQNQNIEEGHFDVTFQFGDSQQLHAHSFVLWASSKVFEKTLFGPLANKGPIPIIRHSYNDFKEFLKFLYLNSCNITMNNVMALVDLGEYYDIKQLKQKCDTFLTQNSTKIENVLKVYESLKVYSLENAMAKVMEFVAENTVEILKTAEFLNVKKETILDIVKMKNLKAKQEDVFEAICKWAEHNCPENTVNKHEFLKQQLENVIPLIDFSSMDFKFLNNFVVRKGFLFPSYDVLADALCEAATKKQRAKEKRLKIVPKRRRILFTSGNGIGIGRKAYVDICDEKIITTIETMIKNNSLRINSCVSNEYCQWNAPINTPDNTAYIYFLIRDPSSRYLTLKQYPKTLIPLVDKNCGPHRKYNCNTCHMNQFALNNDIIAPVFAPNGFFNFDHKCKLEFI